MQSVDLYLFAGVGGTLSSLVLSGIFLLSGAEKLRDLAAFHRILSGYRILPAGWAKPASVAIALMESALGLAVLVAPLRSGALAGIAALLIVYAAALAWNIHAGRKDINCGCSGSIQAKGISWHLPLRNILLAMLALFAARTHMTYELGVYAWAVLLLGGFAALVLYQAMNQLIANSGHRGRLTSHG